ncbi:MAG: hypothetical protein RW306_07165 [Geobacteraceae bacterium]|nr:hypothetical protein [Geobacteraceae bacterium]
MIYQIDLDKLNSMREAPCDFTNPFDLRREGKVFLIGGNLPVFSTLETMYESYCQESSDLFHITFGDVAQFERNIELVRQIKRNFSIRLMGRITYPLSRAQIERVYLAGLDILEIHDNPGSHDDSGNWNRTFEPAPATGVFPRWSVVNSLTMAHTSRHEVHDRINLSLANGVIPILRTDDRDGMWNIEDTKDAFAFLAAGWHRHRVPLKPVVPLLRLVTPFVFAEADGFLRNVIDKLKDRRILAASDLRRHLRTAGAEASFESAGL